MNIYPYAGFWKRVLALLIDGIILFIPCGILQFLFIRPMIIQVQMQLQMEGKASFSLLLALLFYSLCICVWYWLYRALFESGKHQATPGKMALRIKVVGEDGHRISFWRATGRTFARILSANPTLNFGYLMAGFTRHNQTLHDLITRTYVVSKEWEPGQPLPDHAFQTKYCILSIIVALLPFVLIIGAFLFLSFVS